MSGKARITNNHSTIRKWAEKRDGQPATVKDTANDGDAGILRINFPGYAEEGLENISWDEFFEEFDDKDLFFIYQKKTEDGQTSRFGKFISREDAESQETSLLESDYLWYAGAVLAGLAIGAGAYYAFRRWRD